MSSRLDITFLDRSICPSWLPKLWGTLKPPAKLPSACTSNRIGAHVFTYSLALPGSPEIFIFFYRVPGLKWRKFSEAEAASTPRTRPPTSRTTTTTRFWSAGEASTASSVGPPKKISLASCGKAASSSSLPRPSTTRIPIPLVSEDPFHLALPLVRVSSPFAIGPCRAP